MGKVEVREAAPQDVQRIAEMCHVLWPEGSVEEHAQNMAQLITTGLSGALPAVLLVASGDSGDLVGFVEAGLRSHAEGCEAERPAGYIEGWFVEPAFRRRKIGSQLMAAAEEWARSRGCRQMASDTWLDHLESQAAHLSLGFEEVERAVHYCKPL